MKYKAMLWVQKDTKKHSEITVSHIDFPGNTTGIHFEQHLAVFHLNGDPLREEMARDLAKKLVAYLNDLDDKINDVKTLMSIAKE